MIELDWHQTRILRELAGITTLEDDLEYLQTATPEERLAAIQSVVRLGLVEVESPVLSGLGLEVIEGRSGWLKLFQPDTEPAPNTSDVEPEPIEPDIEPQPVATDAEPRP